MKILVILCVLLIQQVALSSALTHSARHAIRASLSATSKTFSIPAIPKTFDGDALPPALPPKTFDEIDLTTFKTFGEINLKTFKTFDGDALPPALPPKTFDGDATTWKTFKTFDEIDSATFIDIIKAKAHSHHLDKGIPHAIP